HDFESMLNQTYDTLRTVATLPGVGSADRDARRLAPESARTVQQLYNNMASHVPVSKLCIVAAAGMEPDGVNPHTGGGQEPIATFDAIVVGDTVVTARKAAVSSESAADE